MSGGGGEFQLFYRVVVAELLNRPILEPPLLRASCYESAAEQPNALNPKVEVFGSVLHNWWGSCGCKNQPLFLLGVACQGDSGRSSTGSGSTRCCPPRGRGYLGPPRRRLVEPLHHRLQRFANLLRHCCRSPHSVTLLRHRA